MNGKTIITIAVLAIGVGIAIWAIHAAGLGCTASCYAPAATSTQ